MEPVRLDDQDVARLIAASLAEIDARYGGQPGSGAPPRVEEFLPPGGAFLLARLDGRPVGCGGLARLVEAVAEVRRMYVAPEVRGCGIGREILGCLLDAARAAGYDRVRLETGICQHEALALYRRAGFGPVPCWGPYAEDPKSVCLELVL